MTYKKEFQGFYLCQINFTEIYIFYLVRNKYVFIYIYLIQIEIISCCRDKKHYIYIQIQRQRIKKKTIDTIVLTRKRTHSVYQLLERKKPIAGSPIYPPSFWLWLYGQIQLAQYKRKKRGGEDITSSSILSFCSLLNEERKYQNIA